MAVPLLDLKAQHATIRDSVMNAMTKVIDEQAFGWGTPRQAGAVLEKAGFWFTDADLMREYQGIEVPQPVGKLSAKLNRMQLVGIAA